MALKNAKKKGYYMTNEEKKKEALSFINEIESDALVLHQNIENAKKYLNETNADDLIANVNENVLDVQKGLHHITIF